MENSKELTIRELEDILYAFLRNRTGLMDLQIEIDMDNPKRLRLYTLIYPAVKIEPGKRIPLFHREFKERNRPDYDDISPSKTCALFIILDDNNFIQGISSTLKCESYKYVRDSNYSFEEYSKTDFVDFFRGTDILLNIKVILN